VVGAIVVDVFGATAALTPASSDVRGDPDSHAAVSPITTPASQRVRRPLTGR
jgi:hypothetical protein